MPADDRDALTEAELAAIYRNACDPAPASGRTVRRPRPVPPGLRCRQIAPEEAEALFERARAGAPGDPGILDPATLAGSVRKQPRAQKKLNS